MNDTKQNKIPKKQQQKHQKPNPPILPHIFRLCHIYASKPETDRVASNSKTRTKYKILNRFPVFTYTLVFRKGVLPFEFGFLG